MSLRKKDLARLTRISALLDDAVCYIFHADTAVMRRYNGESREAFTSQGHPEERWHKISKGYGGEVVKVLAANADLAAFLAEQSEH